MKAHEQFDDLARRKLAERKPPFAAEDWAELDRLLHGTRRRNAAWWWAGALALLIAGGAWWLSAGKVEVEPGQVSVLESKKGAAVDGQQDTAREHAALAPAEPFGAISVSSAEQGEGATQTKDVAHAATEKEIRPEVGSKPKQARASGRKHGTNIPDAATTAAPTGASIASVGTVDVHATSSLQPSSGTNGTDHAANGSQDPPIDPNGSQAQVPPLVAQDNPDAVAPEAGSGAGALGGPENTIGPAIALNDTGHNEPLPMLPEDSAGTSGASMIPPTLPPPTAAAWAFDLRLLGGAFRTRPNYSGGESAKWNTTEGTAAAFGAELRWGGKHLGIGLGVQHMSYRERVRVDEAYETTTSFPVTYNFISVDTTVLNVIDTVTVGGILYYITQQVNTTIIVFDPDIDTVTTTLLTQQQLDRVNSVRYLEIPIFFDLHTAMGKWSFGGCAGPTFGFVIGRHGALPGSTPEATVDFNDQPFRGFQLGYAARVYARYQLGTKWSLGLEPALRGHFGNELKSGDLSRSSSGYGALLSIGCTLR